MCQRLYIASRTELTTVRKTKAEPHLELRRAVAADAHARERFSRSDFPHLYVGEAFAPCGCGFPEELPRERKRLPERDEARTMRRLAESLRPAVRGRPRVQVLLCFMGDEDREVTPGRTVTLDELQAPDFRFRDLEVVTVVKAP